MFCAALWTLFWLKQTCHRLSKLVTQKGEGTIAGEGKTPSPQGILLLFHTLYYFNDLRSITELTVPFKYSTGIRIALFVRRNLMVQYVNKKKFRISREQCLATPFPKLLTGNVSSFCASSKRLLFPWAAKQFKLLFQAAGRLKGHSANLYPTVLMLCRPRCVWLKDSCWRSWAKRSKTSRTVLTKTF